MTWLGRLDRRARIFVAAALVLAVLAMVEAGVRAECVAQVVRGDPDQIVREGSLMRFAVAQGGHVFDRRCAACHGATGQGHFARGVPNLTDSAWLYGEGQVSDIENIVRFGIRAPNARTEKLADMPAFGTARPYPREPAIKPLSPEDVRAVMAYLLDLRNGTSNDRDGAGAKIFRDRGACFDCHARDARGDTAIGAPNLVQGAWLYGDGSTGWLYDSITRGRAGACPAWFDRLNAADIREVSLFVYALSHTRSPRPSQR